MSNEILDEDKIIVNKYRSLLRYAKPILNEGDSQIIRKAFNLCITLYKGMRRKTGNPYILHPLEVAIICVKDIGLGTTSIVSALLSSVLEYSLIDLDEIEKKFGRSVAMIIENLTKIPGNFEYGTSEQAENFKKMLFSFTNDVRVILIKLALRVHNMRTLGALSTTSQIKLSAETIYIYAPLAHRLGLYAIKSELEDLSLKYRLPDRYTHIAETLNATKDARNRFIRKFIQPIQEVILKNKLDAEIKGRPKSIYSIYKKMETQEVSMDEIYDLFAIRIILNSKPRNEKADCWKVYSLITDLYTPNPKRLRDWVSMPKSNGYESLHLTVMSLMGQWVEVQIRTKRMDDIAEKGYAAHWKYKEKSKKSPVSAQKKSQTPSLEIWLSMVRNLIEEKKVNSIEFIEDLRNNIFNDTIFIFTPKGEIKEIEKGASALDFAFSIHTDVGLKCIGAKINGKLVSLDYRLNSGEQVEILTSKKQIPKREWLNFVITSKAISSIRGDLYAHIKEEEKRGKIAFESIYEKLGVPFDKQKHLSKILSFFSLTNARQLYRMIANKQLNTESIRKFISILIDKQLDQTHRVNHSNSFSEKISKQNAKKGSTKDELIIGDNIDYMSYDFASCCKPIPGDEVFGFITVGEGIKIHRTTCPNGIELISKYSYRVIKATWASMKQGNSFVCDINITGTDRRGLFNEVIKKISSELSFDIKAFHADVKKDSVIGTVSIHTENIQRVQKLIEKLKKIEGMLKVSRSI